MIGLGGSGLRVNDSTWSVEVAWQAVLRTRSWFPVVLVQDGGEVQVRAGGGCRGGAKQTLRQ